MMMHRLTILISLVSCCYGWIQIQPAHCRGRTVNKLRREGSEPAGVESVFAKAKKISKTPFLENIANKVKPGKKVTIVGENGQRKRRRRVVQNETEELLHSPGHVGLHEIANMEPKISLPREWEFKNDRERKALAAMKVVLEKDFQQLANKTVTLPDGKVVNVLEHFPDVYGDIRLLRFLRKGTQDPVAASMAYQKFLAWRKANNVDDIRATIEIFPFSVPSNLDWVPGFIPCDFDTSIESGEHEGTGVLISLYIGKWQTNALTGQIRKEEVSLSDFLHYWVFIFESLHVSLYEKSLKQQKMVFVEAISDLKGFSLQQISPAFLSTVVRPWISQLQANYPETAKRINVINPPKVVSLLWKLIVPMLSPGTVAKIRIR